MVMLPCLSTEVKDSCAEVGAHVQWRPFDVIPSIGLMHAGAKQNDDLRIILTFLEAIRDKPLASMCFCFDFSPPKLAFCKGSELSKL